MTTTGRPTPLLLSNWGHAIVAVVFVSAAFTGLMVDVPAASGASTGEPADQATGPATSGTMLGWTMFGLLVVLILLSIVTGRPDPDEASPISSESSPRKNSVSVVR